MLEIGLQSAENGETDVCFTGAQIVHETTNDIERLLSNFVGRVQDQIDERAGVRTRHIDRGRGVKSDYERRPTSCLECVTCH